MRTPWWLAGMGMGCTTSTVDLDLFIPTDTIANVPAFPIMAVIEYGNDSGVEELPLCEPIEAGFLRASVGSELYRGCRGNTVVRGVLVAFPEDRICVTGALSRGGDSLPPEEDWFGYGEVEIFTSDACGVAEAAELVLGPIRN